MTTATNLAAAANLKKPELTPEKLVPKKYHKYLDIFDKEKANCFPKPQPYNHKIKMKARFKPKQIKLNKFLKENLDKGYIKSSKSHGLTFLLCKEERWETMTMPGLPISEQLDHQKRLSIIPYIRNYGQDKRSQVLYQIQCQMGIQ